MDRLDNRRGLKDPFKDAPSAILPHLRRVFLVCAFQFEGAPAVGASGAPWKPHFETFSVIGMLTCCNY